MNTRLVEQRGDQWSVCRMEGTMMRVFVGNYNHEWEAELAAQVAKEDWDELSAYVKQRKKELKGKIEAQLDARAQAEGLPRTERPKTKHERRGPGAYKNAKQLKK